MEYEFIVKRAFEAMENAYAPYSNYHVGACLLTKTGDTYIGANIENASYGAANCGERSAIFAAYSHGVRKEDIEAIAIVTDGQILAAPCGICRQVLSELLELDTPIILSNGLETETHTIRGLMPMIFGKKDLDVI